MTPLNTDLRIQLAAERGDMREALGWNFVRRLERLVDELLKLPDAPEITYVIYSVKWDYINRKIREMWQVTDERPKNHMLGQVIYEINKSGKAECWALPLDVPVPETELSDEIVKDTYEISKNIPLSTEVFEKI